MKKLLPSIMLASIGVLAITHQAPGQTSNTGSNQNEQIENKTDRIGAGTTIPYNNPVIGDPSHVDHEVADPFVLKWNREYYLYTSGDPITAYHSVDLVHWDAIGPVLSSSTSPDAWNQKDVWAPEVVYRNGKFYMYYSATRKSDDWRVEEASRRIGVAVSESPRGPFIDSGKPVTPVWGIDGDVLKDPDSGEEFLFFSYLYEPRLPGTGIVADRMSSWNSVEGDPSHVTRGSEAWEDKDGDPNNGSLRYTNEGPTAVKHHGRYYMLYSGGSWDLPTYGLGYAFSDSVLHPGGLEGVGWQKVVPPILRSTPLVDAPGHNTIVKAPNNVDDINIYHARKIPFLEPWNRLPFVSRVFWMHDRLFTPQPTLADLTPPEHALFEENFHRDLPEPGSSLGPNWRVLNGDWIVSGGWAALRRSLNRNKSASIALLNAPRLSNYVFEVNVRGTSGELAPGQGAGAVAFYLDQNNHVDIYITKKRGQNLLVTRTTLNGHATGPDLDRQLPADFRFDVLHQLLITRNGDSIQVAVDGINTASAIYPLENRRAEVGLEATGPETSFGSVALTATFDDYLQNRRGVLPMRLNTWQLNSGSWKSADQIEGVENAGMEQETVSGRAIALKGDPSQNYEFSASVRLRKAESPTSKVGIVAASSGQDDQLTNSQANNPQSASGPHANDSRNGSGDIGEQIVAGFDFKIWPFGRFWVQHLVNGVVKESYPLPLPRGFLYNEFHTIRVIKEGPEFSFFLDGAELCAQRFEVKASRPGLFTEDAQAAFGDAAMTWLSNSPNLLLNPGFEGEQWDDAGKPVSGNPWKFSGSARENHCCAHSGLRRLLISNGAGEASQSVTGLTPGRYVLDAFLLTAGNSTATLAAAEGHNELTVSSGLNSSTWKKVSLRFQVSENAGALTITLKGDSSKAAVSGAGSGAAGYVVADDFYLYKQH